MPPAKKRKISSTPASNTLWSYFSPSQAGAQSSTPARQKRVRREETPVYLSGGKGKGKVKGGGEGSRDTPIVLGVDEDENVTPTAGSSTVTRSQNGCLPKEPGSAVESQRLNDAIPPMDCTPAPEAEVAMFDPGPSTLTHKQPSPIRTLEVSQETYGEDGDAYWDMGDDEVGRGAEEGEEDDEIELFEEEDVEAGVNGDADVGPRANEEDDDATGLACPLCGLRISDMDKLERHANACLDSPPQPKPPTKSRSPPPLKPLSALLPPLLPPPPPAPTPSLSAFSVLMSRTQDSLDWASAEADEQPGQRGRRKAPFYKVLQGMPIAVDAFRYGSVPGVKAYFLTHAHSDHYTNLSSSWKHGPIYCTETTANLIKLNLKVPAEYVRPLPLNVPTVVPDTGGVSVTLLEANHCPGSALLLFVGPQTVHAGDSPVVSPYIGSTRVFRYLHCGDFRACPRHALAEGVRGRRLDLVYLDTTYLNPKYCFPPQPQVIDACVALSKRVVLGAPAKAETTEKPAGFIQNMIHGWLKPKDEDEDVKIEEGPAASESKPKPKERVLVAIGTYSIGKERIVKAIAQSLSSTVYCDARKRSLLLAQDDPELHALLSPDPLASQVHLLPLQNITVERMTEYLDQFPGTFTRVLGFRPTGWTYTPPKGTDTVMPDVGRVLGREEKRAFDERGLRPMRGASGTYMLYGVPYSEHSSFFELTCFALSVDVVKIIATVNVGSAASRGKMSKWFEKWEAERKKRRAAGGDVVVKYRHIDYW